MQGSQETQVPSPGGEDALEEEMVTHSSILAWRFLWTEESGGLQVMGLQKSQTLLKRLKNNNIIKRIMTHYLSALIFPIIKIMCS